MSTQFTFLQHSEDAALEAAMLAEAMLEKGDMEGGAVWRRIMKAMAALCATIVGSRRSHLGNLD